jgi:hypothetical protein
LRLSLVQGHLDLFEAIDGARLEVRKAVVKVMELFSSITDTEKLVVHLAHQHQFPRVSFSHVRAVARRIQPNAIIH